MRFDMGAARNIRARTRISSAGCFARASVMTRLRDRGRLSWRRHSRGLSETPALTIRRRASNGVQPMISSFRRRRRLSQRCFSSDFWRPAGFARRDRRPKRRGSSRRPRSTSRQAATHPKLR